MIRSSRVDSACRFFPEIAFTPHRSARLAQIAIGLGLTLSCGGVPSSSITLPEISRLSAGLRPPTRCVMLGHDILVEFRFDA